MTILSAGDDRSLRVKCDLTRFESQMRQAPSVIYFRARDYLGSAFGKHRQQWFREKGTKFGRGDDAGKAIKVFGVNEGPRVPAPNQVVYHVTPTDKRFPNPLAAERGLRELRGDAFTGNAVLPVHEFGTDIKTSGFMAIPVKTRPGDVKKWQAANPDKRLEFRPSKKKDGTAVLYEVQRKRARGRPKKGAAPTFNEKLRLRFILTRFVDMKPTLRMYATWDGLDGYRTQQFSRMADAIVRDIQGGALARDLARSGS